MGPTQILNVAKNLQFWMLGGNKVKRIALANPSTHPTPTQPFSSI